MNFSQNLPSGTVKTEHPHEVIIIEGMSPKCKDCLRLFFRYEKPDQSGMPGKSLRFDMKLDLRNSKKSGH